MENSVDSHVDQFVSSPPLRQSLESLCQSFDSSLTPPQSPVYSHQSFQVSLSSDDSKDSSSSGTTSSENSQPLASCSAHSLGAYYATPQMKSKVSYREMGRDMLKELRPEFLQEHRGLAKIMFPSRGFRSAQPLQFNALFLEQLKNVWSQQLVNWRCKLDLASEKNVAKWLNLIGEEFSKVTGLPVLRKWVEDACYLPSASAKSPSQSKRDIVLVDCDSLGTKPATWGNTHAFGEVANQATFDSMMKRNVYTKTNMLFATQETRRFVCSLAIYGKEDKRGGSRFTLCLIDREGLLFQNIDLQGGTFDGSILLRVIAGLMCGDLVGLGYDPTVMLNADGKVETITVEGSKNKTTYRVLERLHVANRLVGRGTRAWRARDLHDKAKEVVIRDAWPLSTHAHREAMILRRLQGVQGVPVVTTAVTVQTTRYDEGQRRRDSTQNFRTGIPSQRSKSRKHRRIVMASVGLTLQHFRSLSELIGAFRDVIIAHHDACVRGVLHRDISLNNIMLDTSPASNRKGLLIDFDLAIYQATNDTETWLDNGDDYDDNDEDCAPASKDADAVSKGAPDDSLDDRQAAEIDSKDISEGVQPSMTPVGTPPFIANAVLLRLEVHQGKHDLESIFYALIYALTIFKGPCSPRIQQDYDLLPSNPSVLEWFDLKRMPHNLKNVARTKMGHLADFEDTILGKMDINFDPLKPFLQTLFCVAFPDRDYRYSQLSHKTMIKLFDDQYNRLKRLEVEEEKRYQADQKNGRAKKRRLH